MTETTTVPARRGRPPASSRREIEAVALELFLENGFTETTLASITAAARVSKTSFFRYFPSKGEIVWAAFGDYTRDLVARLDAVSDDDGPTMDLVKACLTGALAGRIDPDGLWMRRFRVIEASAELRGEESQQWSAWTAAVSGFVARRHGLAADDVVPQSIGGAVHGGYLAVLRSWVPLTELPPTLADELDERLTVMTDGLQSWLDAVAPRTSASAAQPT